MRTEQKNKHMQEANRLAEMEYMKSREEMGVPSPANETSPSYGVDEAIEETDETMEEETVVEEVDETMEEETDEAMEESKKEDLNMELSEIKRITKQLLG